jgi:hypothetical protein
MDFVESTVVKLSSINIFDVYTSNEDRVAYRMMQDDVTSELKYLIESDDDFVRDMYLNYLSNKYFISLQLDSLLINRSFSDISYIRKDARLYKIYLEANDKYKSLLEKKNSSLLEALKLRRLNRRKNKGKR